MHKRGNSGAVLAIVVLILVIIFMILFWGAIKNVLERLK